MGIINPAYLPVTLDEDAKEAIIANKSIYLMGNGGLFLLGGAEGLPVPTKLDFESELPDISGGSDKIQYYFIANMDITSPSLQGHAWCDRGDTEWSIIVDREGAASPDNVTIELNDSNELSIKDTVLSAKEDTANKVIEISETSDDTEYPSAKAVYDVLSAKEDVSNKLTSINFHPDSDTEYPSCSSVAYYAEAKSNKQSTFSYTPDVDSYKYYPSADLVKTTIEHANLPIYATMTSSSSINFHFGLNFDWQSMFQLNEYRVFNVLTGEELGMYGSYNYTDITLSYSDTRPLPRYMSYYITFTDNYGGIKYVNSGTITSPYYAIESFITGINSMSDAMGIVTLVLSRNLTRNDKVIFYNKQTGDEYPSTAKNAGTTQYGGYTFITQDYDIGNCQNVGYQIFTNQEWD
jgi:hypothetical protein